jgi:peptide/nickel transport system permease protein
MQESTQLAAPPRHLRRALQKNRIVLIGLALLLPIIIGAIFAPYLTPFEPSAQRLLSRLRPPETVGDAFPYLLGTDSLGRDIFTRVLYGARISLLIGLISVLIGGALGVALGLVSGFFGGVAETVIMRLADIQLAIPALILALTIMAIFGPSLQNVIIVLGITGWVPFARIVRGEVLTVKEREYLIAARAVGASAVRQMLRHILPNIAASVIVLASLRLGTVIILEASLSFLGLGVQPPTPTWGNMISEGRDLLYSAWWVSTMPGIALSLTVIGVNIVGDWLRDVLDPKLR